MSDPIHWTCPYCGRDTTLRSGDYDTSTYSFKEGNPIDGHIRTTLHYTLCPNRHCKKYTLSIYVSRIEEVKLSGRNEWATKGAVLNQLLIPPSKAKAFPDYIPKVILDDYNEACLIVDKSPKASATLSRRCLQGILRDYWKVKPDTLYNDIEQIKDKTDPLTWEAIESVRKVGNIGAHMEKDINVIIDVEPKEAELLIWLIETLLKDWYIAREVRQNRLAEIKALADKKDDERNAGKKMREDPQQ